MSSLYSGAWKRSHQTDNYLSYFATLAYSLKNRYVFNFSVRNDVSNRFGQDTKNRFDPTYSFGLSWNAMGEEWLQQQKWIHALNMRVTYGIQGNALTNIGPDLVLSRGALDSDYKQFTSKIYRLPNPDLSWERTKSWDLGVDFGLFNLFDLSFDYYWRKSDAIVTQKIAYEYGKTSMEKNGGMLTNEGVEFTLSFTPVRTKNWAFSVALNASKNWNELGKTDYEPTRTAFISGSTSRILKKGYPLGAFWSYSFAGISDEDGRPLFNYLDVPEEERSSDIDPTTYLVYSGTTEPDFTGGLNLSLRWKNLSLSSNFSLLLGGKKRLPSPYENISKGMYMPDATVNLSKDLLKRWQKPGDKTNIPGFVTMGQTGMITLPDGQQESWIEVWENSDVMVANASFFRCNQLSLSWRMQDAWCKRIGVKSLSLNGSVSNLFVIASKRFNGFDPELGNSVHPKNFSIGINVGF